MKRVVELNEADIKRILAKALAAELGWKGVVVQLQPHGPSQDGPIYSAGYVSARAECEEG